MDPLQQSMGVAPYFVKNLRIVLCSCFVSLTDITSCMNKHNTSNRTKLSDHISSKNNVNTSKIVTKMPVTHIEIDLKVISVIA